jgi:hypothetical protein
MRRKGVHVMVDAIEAPTREHFVTMQWEIPLHRFLYPGGVFAEIHSVFWQ